MGFINRLSMRGKLLTLVCPALIVIGLFAAINIGASYSHYREAQTLRGMIELAKAGAPLIEHLQRERGRSAVFFAAEDQGGSAADSMASQRNRTDDAIRQYREAVAGLTEEYDLPERVGDSIDETSRALEALPRTRRQIENRRISAGESAEAYTSLITALLDRESQIVRRASSPAIIRWMSAHYLLAEASEMAGRERAAGASLIRSGDFELAASARVTRLFGRQKALFDKAGAMLQRNERLALERDLENPDEAAMAGLRETLQGGAQGMDELTAEQWFRTATQRIETLNGIGEEILTTTTDRVATILARSWRDLVSTSVIALIAIAVVLALIVLITVSINRQVSDLLKGLRSAMENKDLSTPVPVNSQDEIGMISTTVNDLFARFGEALRRMEQLSVQLASATEETHSTAQQNAAQVKDQQSNMDQVTTATEQMSSTSEEISQNTQQVADAANNATEKSRSGEQVLRTSVEQIRSLAGSVENVNTVINELEQRSGSITEMIEVIRQVAEQTNLLALNAAIEAARAGEHGRGFAVVADEVRSLAQKTQESTTEIETIVNGLQTITDNASRSVRESHALANQTCEQATDLEQTLADILSDVNNINDMTVQIATGSEEQVTATRQLAGRMESISESSAQTLSGSEEIARVASEQAGLARELQDMANEFKVPG
ncbi:methyl-accepting chemotaxis protein [Halomonadaceae bacterium KBTZ08]